MVEYLRKHKVPAGSYTILKLSYHGALVLKQYLCCDTVRIIYYLSGLKNILRYKNDSSVHILFEKFV